MSFFAGSSLKTKDANRSRFLDVLVSKKGGKTKSAPGKTKSNSNFPPKNNNLANSPTNQFGSNNRRSFHSESGRDPFNNENSTPRVNPPANRSNVQFGSSNTKTIYSESGRDTIVKKSTPTKTRNSWDDWTPSQQRKPVQEIPTIRPTKLVSTDQRQTMPSSQMINRKMQNDFVPKQTNRPENSRAPTFRPMQNEQSNRPKEHTQSSTTNNRSSFRSEPPPPTDSTLFFPVGSGVKHFVHGKGIVQPPPPGDNVFAESMLVRVLFENDKVEFDMPMDSMRHTYD